MPLSLSKPPPFGALVPSNVVTLVPLLHDVQLATTPETVKLSATMSTSPRSSRAVEASSTILTSKLSVIWLPSTSITVTEI
ncbi:Uncharacterised protein [Vibrio cholerae]|nr:Uncharacterised protein [Vibrio cholerae]CSI27251.1 Uncharacterised protein [Vibrio cholerae]CSI53280.1 Uncharacterised protein [Vibrio cholerae]